MANDLDAEIIIGGVNYESYLEQLSRDSSLSHPGDEITLTFNPNLPHADILPWETLVVYEQGVKTLTGYVQSVMVERAPAQVIVKGQDNYARALNWYMPENLFTSGSQNIGYWVNYFCNECGLSYQINDTSGSEIVLNPNIPFGMRMISDALINLCAVAQWQMQVDADGVLQFSHIERPSDPDYSFSEVESLEFERNDLDTRNSVKIWGFQDIRGGSILYTEQRTVTGVPDTRHMVFAEPNITTEAMAGQLGRAALDQWARIEELIAADVIGNPSVRVGDAVRIYSGDLSSGSYLDTLTDMRSTLDQNGYNQSLTAGRRAYRYPYWPVGALPGTEIVILLDQSGKVIYTENWTSGSPHWWDHSNGLSGTPKQVFFDRADGFRCFCMTTDGLFAVDNLFGIDDWYLLYTPADVQAALGTGSACQMDGMGIDPRLPGRITFTGGITGGDKYIFYSTDGGFNITSGSNLDHNASEPDEQTVGNISFGPTSTTGLITYLYEIGGFYSRIARKFTANGAVLGSVLFYSNPEIYNVESPGFHQRSAYSSLIIAWPGVIDSSVSRSTNGGSSFATISCGFLPKLLGQAVGLHRNQGYVMAVDTSGSLHRSSNGGQTWTTTASASMTVKCIMNLIDNYLNWVAAGSTVKGTTDVGQSWVTKVGNLLSIVGTPDIIWVDVYNTGVTV